MSLCLCVDQKVTREETRRPIWGLPRWGLWSRTNNVCLTRFESFEIQGRSTSQLRPIVCHTTLRQDRRGVAEKVYRVTTKLFGPGSYRGVSLRMNPQDTSPGVPVRVVGSREESRRPTSSNQFPLGSPLGWVSSVETITFLYVFLGPLFEDLGKSRRGYIDGYM